MTQSQMLRPILALDLGTTTGWALRGFDGLVTTGTASFKPGRYDGGGMRYLRFTNWLTELDRLSGPVGTIWIALAPVPITATRLPVMSTSWFHCAEWNAVPSPAR